MLTPLLNEDVLRGVGRAVVGLSGGGDSAALLVLLLRHGVRPLAVTVDHRLRPGSDADARFAAALCARLDVPHRTVRRPEDVLWPNQNAARQGRYALLGAVAAGEGLPVVVGHTLDDQIETVRMRARRGAALGLAGIPPVATLFDAVPLLRPLLDAPRMRLRDVLREEGIAWLDDPGNADPRFERARLRQGKASVPCERVARLAALARRFRAALMATIAADFASGLRREGADLRYRSRLRGPPLVHALRVLLAHEGGRPYLPTEAPVRLFLQRGGALTLAGTVLSRRDGQFLFGADPRHPRRGPHGPLDRFRPASDDPVHAVLQRANIADRVAPHAA